ncbi:TetR/AcrR family transcriptional regulator [uncultured Enterococcus sp.]|uniref:TetR/AcrR family transcriptional regulator n=1 Tax=uncultured Enterococcus sp. TaxID=167972 RepID=UPI0025D17E42|nr:TetR/AcrR family transcriptional regulator [uncultured Enterococcus sp.]
MDDLKQTLIQDIFDYLSTEVFTREVTGNKLVDFGLNYIDFATSEKRLYRALYLEDSGNGELMQETSFEWFKKVSSTDPEYSTLPDEQFQSVYMGFWIMTTGLASLMSAGIINPTRDRTIEILEDTLNTIVHDNVSIVVDVNHSKEIL